MPLIHRFFEGCWSTSLPSNDSSDAFADVDTWFGGYFLVGVF